jgi:hypothetical protein
MEDAMSEKIERPSSGQEKPSVWATIIAKARSLWPERKNLRKILTLATIVHALLCAGLVIVTLYWFSSQITVLMAGCGALLCILGMQCIYWSTMFLMSHEELVIQMGKKGVYILLSIYACLADIGVLLMLIANAYELVALLM